jgi:16S rRNA A1518/A1519 N6-dimethyltransferase RsmA/KsgA/DIM1 with predicted DNA glycosylase/AP lyase activity
LRAGGNRLGLKDESSIASVLQDSSIDPQRRAETLSLAEIIRLKERIEP